MRLSVFPIYVAFSLCAGVLFSSGAAGQGFVTTDSARDQMHRSEQWLAIEKHLPDPKTASPKELELQADILRARRFPQDAMDYYKYAIARGGKQAPLLNKLGLVELEMRHVHLARAYFERAVKLAKKDAEAWNNLGAVEYLDGYAGGAISDYKRAIKLQRREAVFHANLATAYFEQKDFTGARKEIGTAMKLDPQIFDRVNNDGGVAAHILSSEDRARFSFEMAKMYARNDLEEQMLHSLAMASEAGLDVQREMRKDVVLAKYELDPRVVVLVHNAQALRSRGATTSASSAGGTVPALPEAKAVQE